EDLGEPVAQSTFVHLALEALVERIVKRELQDRRRAHLDLVAVREVVLADLVTVTISAVGGAEIANDDLVPFVHDLGVAARDALVDDLDVGLLAAADDRRLG